ncbi:MAG: hypothetical protein HYZ18_13455 [Pseudogulbenkiania sp.]|nr:hypothetical protein [Pseudogulbenkiania sp.]
MAFTVAVLPAGVTPYLYAPRYQACISSAATAIFLSTMLSLVTLSGSIFLFRSP